ncbi:flexible cuticle protein 12-like [Diabrotica virgifera virgifera]|uniref:Flexible cuticle protein 12-like n=1 Tax=Diabrotica virgifera virgifera TaxID=50390 RepID=A0A6P7F853_DIAVI|nr:flexible cuticle protein 12-like [Diabrotica virgifera virgifera]
MKVQIVLLAGLIAVCVAAPPPSGDRESKILRYDSDVREDGYDFAFETNDPIKRNEAGKIQQVSQEESNLQVNGDFAFNFPEGVSFQTVFVADEQGYRPKVSFGTARN